MTATAERVLRIDRLKRSVRLSIYKPCPALDANRPAPAFVGSLLTAASPNEMID